MYDFCWNTKAYTLLIWTVELVCFKIHSLRSDYTPFFFYAVLVADEGGRSYA